jgi:chromosome segregation ATPase
MADAMIADTEEMYRQANSVVDQETQAVLALAEDLRRQLEHSLELIQALKEDLATAREQQKRAEALAATRTRELEQVKAAASVTQLSNERLVTELGASEEERAEAFKEIRRLGSALDSTSETVRSLTEQQQRQSREAEEVRHAASAREARLKATIKELGSRLTTMERSLEQRTKDLDQANAQVEEMRQERAALEKRIADLERSRQALGKIHTSLSDIRARLLGEPEDQARQGRQPGQPGQGAAPGQAVPPPQRRPAATIDDEIG